MDLNAYEAHQISPISHRSCTVIYAKLRLYILKNCACSRASAGVFELDESYFGAAVFVEKEGEEQQERHLYLDF